MLWQGFLFSVGADTQLEIIQPSPNPPNQFSGSARHTHLIFRSSRLTLNLMPQPYPDVPVRKRKKKSAAKVKRDLKKSGFRLFAGNGDVTGYRKDGSNIRF
jgi:hypothetical protein